MMQAFYCAPMSQVTIQFAAYALEEPPAYGTRYT